MKKVLVIAGLDPSGNSGLLRDLEMLHGFSVSAVVTAHTVQNQKQFFSVNSVDSKIIRSQLLALPTDISAIKIGMLGNEKIVRVLIETLPRFKKAKIVLDPVFWASAGPALLTPKGQTLLLKKLLSQVAVWTPNAVEASKILGSAIHSKLDLKMAAHALFQKYRIPVWVKGGHLQSEKLIFDYWTDGKKSGWLQVKKQPGSKRGTGCALASILAGRLALGDGISTAVGKTQKEFQKWFRMGN